MGKLSCTLPTRRTVRLLVSAAIATLIVAASVGYFALQRSGNSSTTSSVVTISGSAAFHPSLDITSAGNSTYRIHVHESGLARRYNITVADLWKYPHDSLDSFYPCGFTSPIGLAILQGYYDANNFTRGKALTLYNTSLGYSCTSHLYPVAYYLFSPSSDSAQGFDSHQNPLRNQSMTIDFLTSGYWTGGIGADPPEPAQFHRFEGTYTVVAADEWGAVAISHFTVILSSTTGLTLNLSLNASSIRVGHEIAFTASLFNARTTAYNVSSASNWALPYLVFALAAQPTLPSPSPSCKASTRRSTFPRQQFSTGWGAVQ